MYGIPSFRVVPTDLRPASAFAEPYEGLHCFHLLQVRLVVYLESTAAALSEFRPRPSDFSASGRLPVEYSQLARPVLAGQASSLALVQHAWLQRLEVPARCALLPRPPRSGHSPFAYPPCFPDHQAYLNY